MADATTATPSAAPKADVAPTTVKMARAVHEICTGKKPDEKIDAGAFITDAVAKTNKLSTEDLARLVGTGAVELVDVLKN